VDGAVGQQVVSDQKEKFGEKCFLTKIADSFEQ
jgi:hypothetical protein